MKILQLVNRVPYPLNDGGNIGVHYYTQGFLEAGVTLSMLAMNTTRHWTDTERLPEVFRRLAYFQAVKVDNRVKPLAAFINLFKGTSYNIDRFISRSYKKALEALLLRETFDIIQLESLFLTPYIPLIRKYSRAKIVIRQHNIEFRIWERLAQQETRFLRKKYLALLAERLKRYELKHMNDYDMLLPISRTDYDILRELGVRKPMFTHPFGIDTTKVPYQPSATPPLSLYHIGAMDWLPNQESIQYFLKHVMPLLARRLPGLKLYLAGRNMPLDYMQNKWENVIVMGEVPDASAFEKDKSILVVPLQSGGGVRIKIFQAMAMGKTVLTTSVGVEGIEAQNGKEIIIADTPEAFVAEIATLADNPQRLLEIGSAARTLILEKYDRKKLIDLLLKEYRALSLS